jgi:hypothetical protein
LVALPVVSMQDPLSMIVGMFTTRFCRGLVLLQDSLKLRLLLFGLRVKQF